MNMPEEINIILTDRISDILFCPTDLAMQNLQKEAFFFKKPCITLRNETEWVILVENGYNVLFGANKKRIFKSVNNIFSMNHCFNLDLYGNGKASERTAMELMDWFIS